MNALAARLVPPPEAPATPLAPSVPIAAEGAVRVGRNFVYRIGSQALSSLVNVGAMVLLGRALGPEGYGHYAVLYALIPLLSNIAGAGIGMVVTRDVAREPARAARLIGDAIIVRVALGALLFLAVALVSARMHGPGETALILVITAAAVFDYSQDVSIWVLRAHERLDLEARLLLVSQVVWGAIIALAVVLHASLLVLLLAATIAFVIRAAAGAWLVGHRFHRPEYALDVPRLVALVREGLPFGLALFGVVLYGRIGLFMLETLATTVDVSYFQVAFMLSQPFAFVATALSMAMFPGLSRRALQPSAGLRGSLRRAIKYQFVMGLPLMLALVVLAEPLIHLLFKGKGFDQAATALRLLSLGVTVMFLNHTCRYAMAALDRQKIYLRALGAGVLVNVGLCALCIPAWGFAGACLAFLGAECAIAIACLHALSDLVHPADVARDALRPIGAAVAGGLWIFVLDGAPAALVSGLAALTYGATLWWSHALTEGELRVLRGVVRSFTAPRGIPDPATRVSS